MRPTGAQTVLVRGGSHARYAGSGHLVYGAAGTLRAVTFDLDRLEVVGTPTPVVPQFVTTGIGAADFDVAEDGTLVYIPGDPSTLQTLGPQVQRTLTWVDRAGREEPPNAPMRAYAYPRLSPDGTRVALDIRDRTNDIWLWDLRRATLTRLTFDPGQDTYPVWAPDGRRLIFSSPIGSQRNVVWQAADGTGAAELLNKSPNVQFPYAISPDGRWIAYESDESGRREVYVRPFPDVSGGRWQVWTGGGTRPVFARGGRERLARGAPTTPRRMGGGFSWSSSLPGQRKSHP